MLRKIEESSCLRLGMPEALCRDLRSLIPRPGGIQGTRMCLSHFSGTVQYDTSDMLRCNATRLTSQLALVLSHFLIVPTLTSLANNSSKTPVMATLRKMVEVQEESEREQTWWLLCIRACQDGSGELNSDLVEQQLQALGVAKVLSRTWDEVIPIEAFLERSALPCTPFTYTPG